MNMILMTMVSECDKERISERAKAAISLTALHGLGLFDRNHKLSIPDHNKIRQERERLKNISESTYIDHVTQFPNK